MEINIEKSELMYHIKLDNSHGAKYAILPGDPDRVEKIAKHLDNPRFLCRNREYTSWTGTLLGENVLVVSTGIGGPSASIAVWELYQTGVRNFIRVGTCGGMDKEVIGGDLVIATGAIRMEGTSKEYVPIEFPAIADINMTNALIKAANAMGLRHHAGIVQSKDSFYGQHTPDFMPAQYELEQKWNAWIKAGCLASEMETAAVYIASSVLRARAGCVLHTVWNHEREKYGLSNPKCLDTKNAIKTAVEAIRLLIQQST